MEQITESYIIAQLLHNQFIPHDVLYSEATELVRKHMSRGPIKIKLFKLDDTVTEYEFESISELLNFQKNIGKHSVKVMDGIICVVIKEK